MTGSDDANVSLSFDVAGSLAVFRHRTRMDMNAPGKQIQQYIDELETLLAKNALSENAARMIREVIKSLEEDLRKARAAAG